MRSISDQLAELKELAVKERIEVVDIFVEKQTAKAPGRPVFNEMLLRIEQGEANGIWHGIPTDWREIVLMVEKLSICSIRKNLPI